MIKILMIAPCCYPVTGAEEIVNIKMLQALASTNDFEIDLVSKKKKNFIYPSEKIEDLGVKIRHLELCEVDNKVTLKTIWQHVLCFLQFGVVQKGDHWAVPAYKIIKRLINENRYDYVLTKNAPSYLLGCYIKRKFGIKWVATWNDPFPSVKYPEPYGLGAYCKENRMIKNIIRKMECADIHIFPSERLMNHMLKYLKVNHNNCHVVPHAVIGSENRLFVQNYNNGLNLIHSGNLSMPRNPETTLRAMRRFLDNYPEVPLTFTILGRTNEILVSLINELNLQDVVKYISPVEYNKSLEIVGKYNVAVIIEADCPEGVFLPTKVTDFMQIGIPVFSISPSVGVLNDLYNQGSIPYFAPVNDVDKIYETIVDVYQDFRNQCLPANSDVEKIFKPEYIANTYLSFAK